MKTNILCASDPSYVLVAGKLLERMKIDQKKKNQQTFLLAAVVIGGICGCREDNGRQRYRKVSVSGGFNGVG